MMSSDAHAHDDHGHAPAGFFRTYLWTVNH